jgi:hypothetical protein
VDPDVDSTWNITGTDTGSIDCVVLSNIENLVGGGSPCGKEVTLEQNE